MASKSKLKASKSDQIVDHSQALEEDIQFSPPEPLSGSPKPTPQGKKSGPTRHSQRISLSREIREGENLLKLIAEDLIAERIAIMAYREFIEWFGTKDPTTRRMLEEILKDEEDHADDLADLLHQK